MRAFGAASRAKGLMALAAVLCCSAAISASATTFVFDETGSTVPGFVVAASISIDGSPADLPMISNIGNPGPYNFSPVLAFDITLPAVVDQGQYSLANFTAEGIPPFDFPRWTISPAGVTYYNATDTSEFVITGFGALSTIAFESDGPTNPPNCEVAGACVASGHWDPVATAEPAGATLLLAGALGAVAALRRRNRLAPRRG
jgi:hypothetical protein